MTDEPRDEIARRIAAARYPCAERVQPCGNCTSKVFQGCVYLAEAVLTPIQPEYEPELDGPIAETGAPIR